MNTLQSAGICLILSPLVGHALGQDLSSDFRFILGLIVVLAGIVFLIYGSVYE